MPSNKQPGPRVALRFDIDTFQCMHRGVPQLLELADEYRVPLTFFINMGRAVSYPALARDVLIRHFHREVKQETAPKLSSIQKLGLPGLLYTLLANPRVGSSSRLLPEIQSRGHEIGLHGGHNHASWQHSAHLWTEQKIDREIDWGLRELEKAGVRAISSFASPGWNSPAALPALLANKGFTVLADHHSGERDACDLTRGSSQIRFINTNLAGEPGGVGCLEFYQARRLPFTEMAREVEQALLSFSNLLTYDHPAYAGGKGLARLEALITTLKKHDSRFLTVEQMARKTAEAP